jgi:hypothetical protein
MIYYYFNSKFMHVSKDHENTHYIGVFSEYMSVCDAGNSYLLLPVRSRRW